MDTVAVQWLPTAGRRRPARVAPRGRAASGVSEWKGRGAGVWPSCLGMLCLLLLFGRGAVAGDATAPQLFASTNVMLITSTNGGEFTPSGWVYRGDVKVLEPRMYLECELLTGVLQTNRGPRRVRSGAAAEGGGLTNARIDRIIAETNVLIMTREVTLIGDRAVYTQSNEVLVVTGALVIAETEKSYAFGYHFEFDLKTSQGAIVGPTWMTFKMDAAEGMPTSGIGPKPRGRPAPGAEEPKSKK